MPNFHWYPMFVHPLLSNDRQCEHPRRFGKKNINLGLSMTWVQNHAIFIQDLLLLCFSKVQLRPRLVLEIMKDTLEPLSSATANPTTIAERAYTQE
jgi:hypothetical protein